MTMFPRFCQGGTVAFFRIFCIMCLTMRGKCAYYKTASTIKKHVGSGQRRATRRAADDIIRPDDHLFDKWGFPDYRTPGSETDTAWIRIPESTRAREAPRALKYIWTNNGQKGLWHAPQGKKDKKRWPPGRVRRIITDDRQGGQGG